MSALRGKRALLFALGRTLYLALAFALVLALVLALALPDLADAQRRTRRPRTPAPAEQAEAEQETQKQEEEQEEQEQENDAESEAPNEAEDAEAAHETQLQNDGLSDGQSALRMTPRLIEGAFEFGLTRRRLRYRDDLFDHLPDYALGAAPSVAWQLIVAPLTRLSREKRAINWLRGLGVRVFYQRDFIRASSREGVDFRTYSAAIDVELRYALFFGRFRVDAGLGYLRRTFAIDAARAQPEIDNLARIPNVRYQGLTLAGGGAFRISRLFSVGGHAAYHFLFDAGPIEGPLYFPKDRAGAFEFGAYFGYFILDYLELRAGAELLRVHHRFDPEPGDRYIIGGAADRFSRFYLGANIAY